MRSTKIILDGAKYSHYLQNSSQRSMFCILLMDMMGSCSRPSSLTNLSTAWYSLLPILREINWLRKKTFSERMSEHKRNTMISTSWYLIRLFGINILPVCWWRWRNLITFASVTQNICKVSFTFVSLKKKWTWMHHGTWLYFMHGVKA